MIKSKSKFFLLLAIIGLIVVLFLDLFDNQFSFHDILVEFHGLVFDLFVFGILITIYETIKVKKENIERYFEEIDDYRFWFSDESMHRIKGLVNRLIKLKIQKIDLSHCNITACPTIKKMIDWNFSGAKLYSCYFFDIDLMDSRFHLSELYDTNFVGSNLKNCCFASSILNNTNFNDCIFDNTDFLYTYVQDRNWLINLDKKKNKGVDELNRKYIISIDTIQINSIEYYQILDRNNKNRKAKTMNEISMEMFDNMENNILSQLTKKIK